MAGCCVWLTNVFSKKKKNRITDNGKAKEKKGIKSRIRNVLKRRYRKKDTCSVDSAEADDERKELISHQNREKGEVAAQWEPLEIFSRDKPLLLQTDMFKAKQEELSGCDETRLTVQKAELLQEKQEPTEDKSLVLKSSIIQGKWEVAAQWEPIQILSYDKRLKLKTDVFFGSFDQFSHCVKGNGACSVLTLTIADRMMCNLAAPLTKAEFNNLLIRGAQEWQRMAPRYHNIFRGGHFDIETALTAHTCDLKAVQDKSFTGFFTPQGPMPVQFADYIEGCLTFDQIWSGIERVVQSSISPVFYVIGFSDHFSLLRLEREEYYIVETMGRRLNDQNDKAHIIRFAETTSLNGRVSGKDACKVYIKSFIVDKLLAGASTVGLCMNDMVKKFQVEFICVESKTARPAPHPSFLSGLDHRQDCLHDSKCVTAHSSRVGTSAHNGDSSTAERAKPKSKVDKPTAHSAPSILSGLDHQKARSNYEVDSKKDASAIYSDSSSGAAERVKKESQLLLNSSSGQIKPGSKSVRHTDQLPKDRSAGEIKSEFKLDWTDQLTMNTSAVHVKKESKANELMHVKKESKSDSTDQQCMQIRTKSQADSWTEHCSGLPHEVGLVDCDASEILDCENSDFLDSTGTPHDDIEFLDCDDSDATPRKDVRSIVLQVSCLILSLLTLVHICEMGKFKGDLGGVVPSHPELIDQAAPHFSLSKSSLQIPEKHLKNPCIDECQFSISKASRISAFLDKDRWLHCVGSVHHGPQMAALFLRLDPNTGELKLVTVNATLCVFLTKEDVESWSGFPSADAPHAVKSQVTGELKLVTVNATLCVLLITKDVKSWSRFLHSDAQHAVKSQLQAKFLTSAIGHRVKAVHANSSFCALTKKHSRLSNLERKQAVKVKLSAPCQIQAIINRQLRRRMLELKIKHFSEVKSPFLKEHEQVDGKRRESGQRFFMPGEQAHGLLAHAPFN